MAVQSVSMAAQNMWLTAPSLDLAMCWLCAPLFAPETVKQTLALPVDWEPLGLMILGHPAEKTQKTRQPLENKVLWV
jgi:nitroreductase